MHNKPAEPRSLYLPEYYQSRDVPAYFSDIAAFESDIVYQPEIYPVAELLAKGTGRSRIIDVGCGIGRKLAGCSTRRRVGIDRGVNLDYARANFGDAAEWIETDLENALPEHLLRQIDEHDVVICSDVIEHLSDPFPLIASLRQCFMQGALIITSTPDRDLVRGVDHRGPPDNPAHVREWNIAEYRALLEQNGLPVTYIGLTLNNNKDRLLRTIISIHDPLLQTGRSASSRRPLAIVSVFNEEDVIRETISDLINQGCDVHVIDNWSADGTPDILKACKFEFGDHVALELFPPTYSPSASWRQILTRKAEIAAKHAGRWVLHTDADEIRRGYVPGVTLADSLAAVEKAGWNRVNFSLLNFRPVNDRAFIPGTLRTHLLHFEFGDKLGHFLQKKAWIQGCEQVDLASSGGHEATFADARDCPYNFLLMHYPLRSKEHAARKIFQDRLPRWSADEQRMGWHQHYACVATEQIFTWHSDRLKEMNEDFWAEHGLDALLGRKLGRP